MNPLQDKTREINEENEQLINENLLLKQKLKVIETVLKKCSESTKVYDLIYKIQNIISK